MQECSSRFPRARNDDSGWYLLSNQQTETPKEFLFTVIRDREKQQILTLTNLELANVLLLCLKNERNDASVNRDSWCDRRSSSGGCRVLKRNPKNGDCCTLFLFPEQKNKNKKQPPNSKTRSEIHSKQTHPKLSNCQRSAESNLNDGRSNWPEQTLLHHPLPAASFGQRVYISTRSSERVEAKQLRRKYTRGGFMM